MNENKTSIPVKQIFKIGILAANFALMLMLFDTKEEVRALQQETTRLEEGIKILLETKKNGTGRKSSGTEKTGR